MRFYLYRLTIEGLKKERVGHERRRAQNIIRRIIDSEPHKELPQRKNSRHVWMIGDVLMHGSENTFFKLGKWTDESRTLYERNTKSFIKKTQKEAPHTHVVINFEIQVCAIAANSKLDSKVSSIAKNLEKILNDHPLREQFIFHLKAINDPAELTTLMRRAHRITKFEMSFSPPNPFDVEEHFHKPTRKLLKTANGRRGKVSIAGDNLNKDVAEDLAHSAASTGDSVKARIQSGPGQRPHTKKLGENQITFIAEAPESEEDRENISLSMKTEYARVRHGNEGREK